MKRITAVAILVAIMSVFQFTTIAAADSGGAMDLVGMLTSQLGVTEPQAAGGAGALFGMAKGALSESDYGQVAGALTGIEDLISQAPEISQKKSDMAGKIGGMTAGMGSLKGIADSVGGMALVTDQFAKLGLDEGMVSQFIPIILSYANSAGGETVMNLLKSVWK
jgi:hypothetical protein